MSDKIVCALCRKETDNPEEFELYFDENQYFKYICPECYLEEIKEMAEKNDIDIV